jgi:hypothetical protein
MKDFKFKFKEIKKLLKKYNKERNNDITKNKKELGEKFIKELESLGGYIECNQDLKSDKPSFFLINICGKFDKKFCMISIYDILNGGFFYTEEYCFYNEYFIINSYTTKYINLIKQRDEIDSKIGKLKEKASLRNLVIE